MNTKVRTYIVTKGENEFRMRTTETPKQFRQMIKKEFKIKEIKE